MRLLPLLAPLATMALVAAPSDTAPMAVTNMALSSTDGFALKGTLSLPPAKEGRKGAKAKVPVVILAHQFGADRAGWAPLVERLHARGIGTLALDLRGHGDSTLKDGATVKVTGDFAASAKAVGFDHIPADLAQAAEWLRKQPGVDGRRIGLAGASLGAFSALLAGPAVQPVAILSLSPAGSIAFGEGALGKLKDAVVHARATSLVLASSGDKEAFENTSALKDLPGVALNIKDGEEHGFAYLKERADLMAVFFGEYLAYHHTGETVVAAKKETTPGNVINDKTLAEKKAAEGSKS
jgi:dienelactone hydrolase